MKMKKIYSLLLGTLIFNISSSAQTQEYNFPLVQRLTLENFVDLEMKRNIVIESEEPNVSRYLSKSVYPFLDSYKIAQPLRAYRISDSTKISIECYFTKPDSIVKYISYSYSLNMPSLDEILEKLEKEGEASQENIRNAMNKIQNDPNIPKVSTSTYLELKKHFTDRLGQPQSISNQRNILEHTRLSWRNKNLYILLGYQGKPDRKSGVILRIFWE